MCTHIVCVCVLGVREWARACVCEHACVRACMCVCVCVCINEHNSSIQRSKYMRTYIIHKLGTCADSDTWHRLSWTACTMCVSCMCVRGVACESAYITNASLMQTYLTKPARHTTSKGKTYKHSHVRVRPYVLTLWSELQIHQSTLWVCLRACMYVRVYVCVCGVCVRVCMCMYVCVRMRVCVEIIITAVHNVQEYMDTRPRTCILILLLTEVIRNNAHCVCVVWVACVCVYVRALVSQCARICSSNAYLTDKMSIIQHPNGRYTHRTIYVPSMYKYALCARACVRAHM